ncbi:MAG: hypothetical protein RI906_1421 [Pseudomonadota bacterium]|jgi:5-oxopent-3-ene-1,2,5-tricarboxylate decarboxylase/2-hydroxyhepta-2,4-diene-1,7-dioate isomerase
MNAASHSNAPLFHDLRSFTPATVYCAMLNQEAERERLAAVAAEPPYRGLPKAPVLAIRPANTLAEPDRPVRVPEGVSALEVWPCLVAVIEKPACRVPAAAALEHVGGWSLALDFSLPLSNWHRPAIRQKCHDGFCKLMPVMRPADSLTHGELIPSLDHARVVIDAAHAGTEAQPAAAVQTGAAVRAGTEAGQAIDDIGLATLRWHRDPASFLAAVSQFMTLHRGDCMMFPLVDKALQVGAGQGVLLDVPSLGCWQARLEAAR